MGSFYPGYDANGNLTSDGVHSYAWDADGNSITIDSIGLTFDALARMVEQNRSGVYTQVVYGPTGSKLALMNGQTLAKGFVPLAGGATAVYNSGGLAYYRHSDWLGSSRLASTPSRTAYYDGAYAPYGENYAETGATDRSFTGQNQDTISSGPYALYDFLYREHHPVWGRWVSPDPAGLAAVDITNPQSLNRYAYVLNNPTTLTDPLGLQDHEPHFQDVVTRSGGSCYVDQINTPCVMAFGLLGMGATVLGPPPGTWLPLTNAGRDRDCPGCLWNPDTERVWDPDDPENEVFYFTTVTGRSTVRATPNPNPANNGAVIQQATGKEKPNVPPQWGFCSSYRDGTGAGEALYQICMNTPNSPWGNCVRGKLTQQFVPNDNPLSLVFRYGVWDHSKDFLTCAVQ